MPDPYYPSVDVEFIEKQLKQTGRFDGYFIVGSTRTFILSGPQAIYKRTILIRELTPGQVCYEQATGLAARFRFMGPLLEWFRDNRNWHDGAYVESQRT